MGNIFDYSNGEFIFGNSEGDSFMSQDGHLMRRMSDTSMLDLQTGEMHITSSNGYDDFENKMYGFDDEDDPFKLFQY